CARDESALNYPLDYW
nr:immunoglobulin heavy chain junction region [Macaca mulatta]MOV87979.1 immunoglobulin heavy chain junction region [Macaca mulatta]MOV91329.1 immunoglobulin heavy chain junction region [Macaca mulatta]